ncbi:hypothetical protein [uncultured Methanospirillum sp.]|uniref:hypothetical protein n=1 Tax=uncultured Methanospirillum sp. TaxID=262503 RepID=UPI0029C874FD|nr:hypothetical protein [uncultured Methanospirillum sp.]
MNDTPILSIISDNSLQITLIGAFFGALLGVSLPIYYLEILNDIKLRKSLKSEIEYNLNKLKELNHLIIASSIRSPYLEKAIKHGIKIDMYLAYHPFPLKICSNLVFQEKWIDISSLQEDLVMKLKKYYEDIQELQQIIDYIIAHQQAGVFNNDILINYALKQKEELIKNSRELLQYHEFNCFGKFNAIWQRFFLK